MTIKRKRKVPTPERQVRPTPLTICQEADFQVNGPKADDYGDARVNFTNWRNMCQATGRPGLATISAEDLAVVMICLKTCRNTHRFKRDSAVDGAGYFDLWDRVKGL